MKRILLSSLALLTAGTAWANLCGLPLTSGAGAGQLTGQSSHMNVSVGLFSGVSKSSAGILSAGFQTMSLGAYLCFMSTDTPLAVQSYPGTLSVQRLVPSASKTMTLEWTESFSPNPVTYQVFFGTNPLQMSSIATGLTGTNEPMTNLDYTTVYSWQVAAADQFGRTALSEIYTFSLVPVVGHLIAAPNPFHPGHGTTTFLFSMAGPGDAIMEIYSLPDERRVFRQDFTGLQDGPNTITYDGRDNNGRFLPNGVFTVRLIKHGANGNATELFKIISAR